LVLINVGGPVSSRMGNRLRAAKPLHYVTSHPGINSAWSPFRGTAQWILAKAGDKLAESNDSLSQVYDLL